MRPWLCAAVALAAWAAGEARGEAAPAQPYSAAETLLFLGEPLRQLQPPLTLRYRFHRSGGREPAFDDTVQLVLRRGADGVCCAAHTDFLSDTRRLSLPDLPAARANPVILHFLERDVREMQRLTGGSQAHFRRRIRMAVFEGATVQPQTVHFGGRPVAAHEVRIAPYVDDPHRARFDQLANKAYRFVLSDAVPGGVLRIRSEGGSPSIVEELTLEADAAPAPQPHPAPR